MADKPKNVPNAADVDKDETDEINPMGHPERSVKQPGKPVKRVLNELDPECQKDNIKAPIKLQEFAMARISEAVQDYKGVKGDFMDNLGGRTDKLGGKQKNTGATEPFGKSSSGEACDGITTKLKDMNLKTKQKNVGGGFETETIASAMADDGITKPIGNMCSELGQNSAQKNKGGQFETFKGSTNTMSNRVAEEWSLDNIANIMEGDGVNLQSLFESYSKQSSYVCLEDFQQLCHAHGIQTTLSENNLKSLMAASKKFMFYEGNDASGRFWQPRSLTEMVGSGDVAVAEVDEIPPEISDEVPEMPEVPEVPEAPEAEAGLEIPGDETVEAGPDDLADVFQKIGDDFAMAANMMAGHDESSETPEDEAAEGDNPFASEAEAGEAEAGDEEEAECTEEVCDEEIASDEPESPESGDMMGQIGSAVKGKATAVAMKGREEDEKNAVDPSKEVVKTESCKCKHCGTVLDENGCMLCDFLRESKEIGEMDGEDAKADKDGHYTTDKTKSGKGELSTKIPPQETCESTSAAASDGITTEIPGKQTPLKPKMKNVGGQAAFKGGAGTMKENILKLSRVAKEAIESGARKIGRAGKYAIHFGVKLTDSPKSSATFSSLTDALAVVEELLQVVDGKKIVFEAQYTMPHQKTIIHSHKIPIAKTKRRDPVSCEGKILFKTGKVASAFADRVVSEGVACRVKNHNWGAAVVGSFSWPVAQRAFSTISEAWGTQIRSPEREAFQGGYEEEFGDDDGSVGLQDAPQDTFEREPEYGMDDQEDQLGPGPMDIEGNLCPNCGSSEGPDENGLCYGCGEHRSAGAPEREFGARPDPRFGRMR
ncbi:MAG: hypothetical protein M0R50_08115 [Candidatus Cloacimonetes bacterium]|nr:hypothetical protein [Candidatus Cloacimonadota bacterium]